MKRSMLVAICLLFGASTVFAQAGAIGAFADPAGANCNLLDSGGLVQVQLVHVYTTGATASQFRLVPPAGWTHLGDTWNFTTVIGSSIAGASVAYGACFAGPISLGVVNFFGAAVPPCTLVNVTFDPAALSGQIEAADCAEPVPNKMFPTGGAAVVNSDGSCDCLIPVHDTTWGGVKALYQ